jgi:hypothetical protein
MFRPLRHTYRAVAVDHRRGLEERQPPATATLVLYRCGGCGDAYSQTIDGNWTLAQVRGEDDDRAAFVPPKAAELPADFVPSSKLIDPPAPAPPPLPAELPTCATVHGDFGGPRGRPEIEAGLHSADPVVRQAAAETLIREATR